MGRLYHAKGVERLVRNDLWKGRTPERFYDAMEWLYGWNVEQLPRRTDTEPIPTRRPTCTNLAAWKTCRRTTATN